MDRIFPQLLSNLADLMAVSAVDNITPNILSKL
jgi:hypothetical protein